MTALVKKANPFSLLKVEGAIFKKRRLREKKNTSQSRKPVVRAPLCVPE